MCRSVLERLVVVGVVQHIVFRILVSHAAQNHVDWVLDGDAPLADLVPDPQESVNDQAAGDRARQPVVDDDSQKIGHRRDDGQPFVNPAVRMTGVQVIASRDVRWKFAARNVMILEVLDASLEFSNRVPEAFHSHVLCR